MNQCQCKTLKNQRCKLSVSHNSKFCWRHRPNKQEKSELAIEWKAEVDDANQNTTS